MEITDARREDAPLIARAIMEAAGEELCSRLAGNAHTQEELKEMFTQLAASEDSQYSYRHTRIAVDSQGNPFGVCISYDGAEIKRLRRPFFTLANKTLGWNLRQSTVERLPTEADQGELYLDTLMVLPGNRHRGIGAALIDDALEKARGLGKPLGLLCEPDNEGALRLYKSKGFRREGYRKLAGIAMHHLVLE